MPDIAVEVRSPSTWRYDIGAKKSGYERRGLPELWLVDTRADEVLWGYLPRAQTRPVLAMPSGRTVTIDGLSHEGLLEDQGGTPVDWSLTPLAE